MKEQRFRKSGRDFHRRAGVNWHILNVQASQGNVETAGKFTVNLGVLFTSDFKPCILPRSGIHAKGV